MVCWGLKSMTTGPTNMLQHAFRRPPIIWTTITKFGFLPDIFLPCPSFSASSTVHTKATVPLPKLHPATFSFPAHLKWVQFTSHCLASPHQGPPSSPPPESTCIHIYQNITTCQWSYFYKKVSHLSSNSSLPAGEESGFHSADWLLCG